MQKQLLHPQLFARAIDGTRLRRTAVHAAQLVLVQGVSCADAAKLSGVYREHVVRAVGRVRRALLDNRTRCVACGGVCKTKNPNGGDQ